MRLAEGRIANALYLLSVSSLVVFIDRMTKYLIVRNFSEGESAKLVPGFFHITLVLNSGAAFGLFKGRGVVFMASSVLVMALICVWVWRNGCRDLLTLTALGLILGGAAGNLIDRAASGHVIDFLDFRIWPVFNMADSSITIGVVALVSKTLFGKRCSTI